MLNTDKQQGQVIHVNTRIQNAGATRILAADTKIGFMVNSDVLNDIHPGLRDSLYRQPDKEGDQLQLDAPSSYTVLRHPGFEPMKFKHKFPGYEITLTPPEEGAEPLVFLVDVTVKKIEVDPQQGGSALITLTASAAVDLEEAADLLDALVREDVLITLVPPTDQEEGEEEESEEGTE